ncbi:MAG: shikimate dehydrogenase [Endomicrobiales bacterium]|nr:shikimate dehydrogenase [Endomicrobiales bacterium]
MKISASTKITGLFGFPVKHTLSPAMHNAAFSALGLDFIYLPFEVKPGELASACGAVRSLSFRGVNVTVPHKERIIPFLDSLDPLAKAIGSVNTVVNTNGKLKGYNTDARGFLLDLNAKGFAPKNRTAAVFGAGGAGKAVAHALSSAGIKRILVTDIEGRKARSLAKRVSRAVFVPLKKFAGSTKNADLLVNATPVGMRNGDRSVALAKDLKRGMFVYDLVYNRKTELGAEARKAGAKYSGGLGMLMLQGAVAFEIWTGRRAPVAAMKKALERAFKK